MKFFTAKRKLQSTALMKTALALAKACTLFQFFYELRVVSSLELFLFLGGLLSSFLLRCHVQPPF